MAFTEVKLSDIGLVDIDGIYYHQTHREAADHIIRNGFTVFHGGNQRFSDGCYFLNHPYASYGPVTLSAHISGVFVDFSKDDKVDSAWTEASSKYMKGSYTTFAENLQREYPGADGLNFGTVVVVWNVSCIDDIKIISDENEAKRPRLESLISKPTTDNTGAPLGRTPEEIADFWEWFGSSKAVDSDGRPLAMYHGTSEDFDTFEHDYDREDYDPDSIDLDSGYSGGNLGIGFYFTDDERYADRFGSVSKYYLRIIKLLDASDDDVIKEINRRFKEDRYELIYGVYGEIIDEMVEEGRYDSIKGEGVGGLSYGSNEWVVLSNNQIRKAMDTSNTSNKTKLESFISSLTDDKILTEAIMAGYAAIVEVGTPEELYADLLKDAPESEERGGIPKFRGITADKVKKHLRSSHSDASSRSMAIEIGRFSNIDDLANHLYYHGTGTYLKRLKVGGVLPANSFRSGGYEDLQHSISLSKSKNMASDFTGDSRSGTVYPVLLKKNTRVLNAEGKLGDAMEVEDHLAYLWDANVDAVYIGGGEEELVVLNPRAIVLGKGEHYPVYQKQKFSNIDARQFASDYGFDVDESGKITKRGSDDQGTDGGLD